jgi:eukaryotic-like serine/threonine-protein kinase
VLAVSPSSTPKELGPYEVGAKVGGGGMATIYLGRRVRDDGGEDLVALKVIRDELAHDEAFTRMFIDEAKILARLSHPNIIRTLEYGVTGRHNFIAMELLSGRTFADLWDVLRAQGEPMPLRLGAWICARVAEGLHLAHELLDEDGEPLGVIHRDVNPGNVFLTLRGEVKLIDFGLAKARVRLSDSIQGIVKGKIPYLAPEQAAGDEIDRRVDVYALGATLWETATMTRLFKRDTDVATLKAILAAHVPDVREMVDDFPEELWSIIERALSRDPAERYATADELRAALDAFVGDASRMADELADLMERHFPDDEADYAEWLREAQSVRVPSHPVVPPPAQIPVASTSLFGEAPRSETLRIPPRPKKKAKPGRRARARARARGDGKKRREVSSASQPPPSSPRHDERSRARAVSRPSRTAWVGLGVTLVVAVLLFAVLRR